MKETKLIKGDLHKIGKFFIWLGIIFILFLGILCVIKINKMSSFVSTQAKIIDVESYRGLGPGKRSTIKYFTTIEFYIDKGDYNNSGYNYTSKVSFHRNKQGEMGDYIPILYDPKNPSDVNINKFFYLWGFFIFFGIISFISVMVGVFIYRKEKNYNF